jgi:prophage regulatory protein
VSQASGSTSFIFAVCSNVAMVAHVRPPPSLPAKSEFFRVIVCGRMARSTMLESESLMPKQTELPRLRTIRRHQLQEVVPLADSTIYEMEQRGEFPRRFALSPRCVVWDLAEVEAWLHAQRSQPIARVHAPDVAQRIARPVKGRGLTRANEPKAE